MRSSGVMQNNIHAVMHEHQYLATSYCARDTIRGVANAPKQRMIDAETRVMAVIEDARQSAGMSQEALAAMVGVSQGQMSRMLSGERPVTLPELFMMCAALRLDPASVIAVVGD